MTKNYLLLALLGMLLSLSGAMEAREPLSPDMLPSERPFRIACPNDAPPFSFVDDQGDLKGITIDLWRLWSEKMKIDIRFVPAIWEDTLTMLRDGQADIHSGLMFNEERESWLEFAAPVAFTEVNFFFHRTLLGVERLEDLRAFKIGVIAESYLEIYLRERIPDATLVTYPTFDELLAAAERGDIRVFVRSIENTLWELRQHGLTDEFRFHPERPLHRHPFWAAVLRGQPALAAAIRQGMNMITDEERAEIERRWVSSASVKTRDTLVIGMSRMLPPLTYLNEQAQPVGLFVDIWRLWAEKTGTRIEFSANTWPETLNKLKSGEVDIHSGLFASEERDRWISYSQPLYQSSAALFYPVNRDAVTSLKDLEGQPVGVIKQTHQEAYLRRQRPEITLVPFETTKQMIRAAEQGRIRAFAAETLAIFPLLSELGAVGLFEQAPARLYTRKIYAGVLKENADLLTLVDQGFNAISNAELAEIEARWIANPSQRYYRPASPHLRLTAAEDAWLKGRRSVRVGIVPECPPMAFRSPQGEIVGITPDYLRLLGERIGIRFDLIPAQPSELGPAVRSHALDLIPSFELPQRASSMNFSNSFRTVSWVIVSRDETPLLHDVKALQGKKVALITGVKLLESLAQKYPKMIPVPVETPLEALQAVSSGQADACIIELSMAGYLFRQFRLSNLKIAGLTRYTDIPVTFAVRNDWPELRSILNKAIDSISPAESERIEQTWIPVPVAQIVDWTRVWQWGIGIGSVVGLILALALVWNRRLAREIAERKRAEQALRESEEKFSQIFHYAPLMIALSDLHTGTFIDVNQKHLEVSGYTRQDLIGKRSLELDWISPEDRARLVERLQADGYVQDQDIVVRTKDQKPLDCLYSGVLLEIGGQPRILSITQDITARKQAEEALQQSQTLLMEAERLAQVGAWEWDIASDIFTCSAEWQRIHGVQQSHILVKDLLPIAHPDDRERIQTAWQDALAEMQPYDIEHRIVKQDTGEERVIQAYGEVFGNTNSQPLKMYGAAQDITDRKRAEEQIRAALHEKEVLLREIHHRVKNNMMVVTSLIQMQADQTTEPNALALFRDLYNRVLAMAMVHEDLYQSRDLAQIDFGTYLERLVINIRSGFAKTQAAIKINAAGIVLDIHHAIPCGLIVAELVTNAFKYAFSPAINDRASSERMLKHPDRGPESPQSGLQPASAFSLGIDPQEIRVEMHKTDDAYTLIVSDNGVGLPPDFDMQTSRTLGMSLVRSWVVHQLKGKIELDTQAGTMFRITF